MRVLHVSPSHFGDASVVGGAERYAWELARAMARVAGMGFVKLIINGKLADDRAMSPPLTGRPNSIALPSVGGSRPVSIFIVVDLPQPFEPRKPKISPFSMRKLT